MTLGQLSVDAHCDGVCGMWRSQSKDSETARSGKGIFPGGKISWQYPVLSWDKMPRTGEI